MSIDATVTELLKVEAEQLPSDVKTTHERHRLRKKLKEALLAGGRVSQTGIYAELREIPGRVSYKGILEELQEQHPALEEEILGLVAEYQSRRNYRLEYGRSAQLPLFDHENAAK